MKSSCFSILFSYYHLSNHVRASITSRPPTPSWASGSWIPTRSSGRTLGTFGSEAAGTASTRRTPSSRDPTPLPRRTPSSPRSHSASDTPRVPTLPVVHLKKISRRWVKLYQWCLFRWCSEGVWVQTHKRLKVLAPLFAFHRSMFALSKYFKKRNLKTMYFFRPAVPWLGLQPKSIWASLLIPNTILIREEWNFLAVVIALSQLHQIFFVPPSQYTLCCGGFVELMPTDTALLFTSPKSSSWENGWCVF